MKLAALRSLLSPWLNMVDRGQFVMDALQSLNGVAILHTVYESKLQVDFGRRLGLRSSAHRPFANLRHQVG
jgi:hypothetical protein